MTGQEYSNVAVALGMDPSELNTERYPMAIDETGNLVFPFTRTDRAKHPITFAQDRFVIYLSAMS